MARRYFIFRQVGGKLTKTWWTDNDPPERGVRATREIRPVGTIKKAREILQRAQESFPKDHYEIKRED